MTVKHLQTVQRQQLSTAVATDPAVLTKFRTGFSECATEVSRYVSHLENVEPAVKQRLVSHLNNCVSHLQQVAPFYSHYVPYMPERLYPEVKVGFQTDFQNGDENNNGSARIQIPSGVQLIPSRLPTGELALLVPQSAGISANFPFFPPAPESAARIGPSSAFTAVQRSHSPLLSPSTSTSSYDESHNSEQYPHAQSPHNHHNHQFKIPEQSPVSSNKSFSSPETQKPQISSTSDRKSPPSTMNIFVEPKSNDNNCSATPARVIGSESFTPSSHSTGELINGTQQILRQPLSVITEKTCNRPSLMKRENLKRHHSDGLLSISEKKLRLQEPSSSAAASTSATSFRLDSNEHTTSAEDLSGRNNFARDPRNTRHFAGPSNGDMWRPW